MNKRILLTGGNGFLARSFYDVLVNNYSTSLISRDSCDLNDHIVVANYLKKDNYDVVIHCATYDAAPKDSLKDSKQVLENNLQMFFNLVRCSDYYGKLLFFGSGAEFSRPHWKPKMGEDYFDSYVPLDQYGFSKYIMTKYCLKNTNIYNLRLFGVHGRYEDWRYRFISNVCCHAVFNLPIIINQNAIFDFLYIDDLVKIVKWFIDNEPKYKVYNVCSGKVYDYITVSKKIVDISHKKLDIIVKNKDCRTEYSGDNSLLKSELGGFDFTPMDESLNVMYNWYEEHKDQINPDMFHY